MKKFARLLLASLVSMVLASTAYAVPDRMTTYMLQSILTEENFSFTVGWDTAHGDMVRRSVYDAVENDNIAPIDCWALDCFGTPVKSAAQALTGGDVEAMTLCSFATIAVSGYDTAKFADEQAVFHFTNAYPLNLNFVAVAGALKYDVAERMANGEMINPIDLYDWQALRAEPVDPNISIDTDDGIDVHFTREALMMVNDKDAVVALFCEVKSGNYAQETSVTPATPSKTVDDVTTIKVYDDNNIKNLIIDIIVPLDERGQKELDNVGKFIATDTRNIIEYFDADVAGRIQSLLPDVDLNRLQMNDFSGTIAHNYTYAHGEVIARVTFPTFYADGTRAVALVGVFKDDGSTVWTPLKAEALNGSLLVYYTQNAVTCIEEESSILMILREAAE